MSCGLAEAGERVRKLPELSPDEDARLVAAAEADPDNPPLREERGVAATLPGHA